MGKVWNYWKKRPKVLQPLDNESWMKKGFNEGVRACLDILLTPEDERK